MTNSAWTSTPSGRMRARGLGLAFEGRPGPANAITDVPGVSVGYSTIISGDGPLVVGRGPVRTGVTAILPRPRQAIGEPVFAGFFSLNGNGELSGTHYIEEAGKFSLPVTITNTHSCGLARDATIRWAVRHFGARYSDTFSLPVAAETYDGFLNDINGFHVQDRHVFEAIDGAAGGSIEEGSVGGGTGMKCFGFKAGSGTASRLVEYGEETFTVGVFVQANFGTRRHLTVLGRNIGALPGLPEMQSGAPDRELSSIIAVVATDAPLLPHQLKRLARRVTFGVGRTGGLANHGSGDLFLAFSTANTGLGGAAAPRILTARYVPDEDMDPLFEAVAQATEEAILNSMIANETMTGRDRNVVPALPHGVTAG
ncbi:L-aminopeptidase/D-esterase-like protein [Hoeflea marina]|uniref:L-aminopeptidase/D-esterase-like protein n=1 Tax=Hoeflea marina TaxID=274592 RepID=A0A317PGT2_9HYPH|nr:P1 family peptidase [Hoeflea marina]PWV99245.1 L-aminopeptidase/D-esterase-like protein [Hoeflea marina]